MKWVVFPTIGMDDEMALMRRPDRACTKTVLRPSDVGASLSTEQQTPSGISSIPAASSPVLLAARSALPTMPIGFVARPASGRLAGSKGGGNSEHERVALLQFNAGGNPAPGIGTRGLETIDAGRAVESARLFLRPYDSYTRRLTNAERVGLPHHTTYMGVHRR